jgi:hypothetical protein
MPPLRQVVLRRREPIVGHTQEKWSPSFRLGSSLAAWMDIAVFRNQGNHIGRKGRHQTAMVLRDVNLQSERAELGVFSSARRSF